MGMSPVDGATALDVVACWAVSPLYVQPRLLESRGMLLITNALCHTKLLKSLLCGT